MSTQQALFTDEPRVTSLGSRWRTKLEDNERLYELDAIEPDHDPIYRYRLRLLEVKSRLGVSSRVGDTIHVELAWFTKRPDVRAVGGGR